MDKKTYRDILESGANKIELTLDQFIKWYDDDEWSEENLDMFEKAMIDILEGNGDPKAIALEALKKYRGEG